MERNLGGSASTGWSSRNRKIWRKKFENFIFKLNFRRGFLRYGSIDLYDSLIDKWRYSRTGYKNLERKRMKSYADVTNSSRLFFFVWNELNTTNKLATFDLFVKLVLHITRIDSVRIILWLNYNFVQQIIRIAKEICKRTSTDLGWLRSCKRAEQTAWHPTYWYYSLN